ncbi:MAG TPA: HD domain-containing phosphohydrolase [bacterium]|nr:HD domain-containing phosphohydrolase [bacterium]
MTTIRDKGNRDITRGHDQKIQSIADATRRTSRASVVLALLLALIAAALGVFAVLLPISRENTRQESQVINTAVMEILTAPPDADMAQITHAALSSLEDTRSNEELISQIAAAPDRDVMRAILRNYATALSNDSYRITGQRIFGAGILIALSALMLILLSIRIGALSAIQEQAFERIKVTISAINRAVSKPGMKILENDESWLETSDIVHRSNAIIQDIEFDRDLLTVMEGQSDLESTIQALYPVLARYLPCERLAVAFVDQFGEVVAEAAFTTAAEPRIGPGFSMPIDDTSLGEVSRERRVRIINNLEAHARASKSKPTSLILEEGFRSSLTVPLVFGERCVGFLFLNSRTIDAYQGAHIPIAERFGSSLAGAIYHHYLVQLLLAESSKAFVKSMEHRDNETGQHLNRISLYSMVLARCLANKPDYKEALSPRTRREILWYSPLHDIGKVGIPDAVLLKPGPLTPDERTLMETHVEKGSQIISSLNEALSRYLPRPPFSAALAIIEGHHERWDGKGYPHGVKGEAIPIEARIVAAADILDALTTKRPYKEAWSFEDTYRHMAGLSGTHLDSGVYEALVECRAEIERIAVEYREP